MIQVQCWLMALHLEKMGLVCDDRKPRSARFFFGDPASATAFIEKYRGDFMILRAFDRQKGVFMSAEEWLSVYGKDARVRGL